MTRCLRAGVQLAALLFEFLTDPLELLPLPSQLFRGSCLLCFQSRPLLGKRLLHVISLVMRCLQVGLQRLVEPLSLLLEPRPFAREMLTLLAQTPCVLLERLFFPVQLLDPLSQTLHFRGLRRLHDRQPVELLLHVLQNGHQLVAELTIALGRLRPRRRSISGTVLLRRACLRLTHRVVLVLHPLPVSPPPSTPLAGDEPSDSRPCALARRLWVSAEYGTCSSAAAPRARH